MGLYGAIDVGTNSVRLLVAEVQNGNIRPLCKELITTRLGEGMETGVLTESAISRTVEAVHRFAQIAFGYRVRSLRVVATSAARGAKNGHLLTERLAALGITLEVVSGEREACLSYLGVVHGLSMPPGTPVVVDIGGGSTEIVYPHPREGLTAISVPVGAVRCSAPGWHCCCIEAELASPLAGIRELPIPVLIGVGGTVTSLAAMEQGLATYDPAQVHGYFLPAGQVSAWLARLEGMTLAERKTLPGLMPARADIITAGVRILDMILTSGNHPGIIASETDLLEGLIWDQAGDQDHSSSTPWTFQAGNP